METATMGKVTVAVKIENLSDSLDAKAGTLAPGKVRAVEVPDALVDTGAKLLSLPKHLIAELGLELFDTRQAQTAAGIFMTNLYCPVKLTVDGRFCTIDVAEVPDDCPVLIGYVPLELLDFVVDPVLQRLVPTPQYGGQRILDLF